MKNLKPKHIAHYLPFGIPCKILNYKCDYVGIKKSNVNGYYFIGEQLHLTYDGGSTGKVNGKEIELYLRPLSDLTSVIEHNGKKYCILSLWFIIDESEENDYEILGKIPDYWQTIINAIDSNGFSQIDYGFVKILLEHHFDIGRLIPAGLAIDINTLGK